ncbi:hypothetical protein CRD59_04885 [Bifidobacterium xylocopae]|uniref:RelE/ParE family protein n=2 Tax=Bifidobacterium xylocopae TaxID=2493119 RepID=A0A366KC36_9BIFI|nr:hypothetical protein CRD59_04885 [Bifidobacterium xylocopae]
MRSNDYWSDKDQKQFQHIETSEQERGQDEKTAERIAAATVNKERSRQGRTKAQQEGKAKA